MIDLSDKNKCDRIAVIEHGRKLHPIKKTERLKSLTALIYKTKFNKIRAELLVY
jgi:hypothetical protein